MLSLHFALSGAVAPCRTAAQGQCRATQRRLLFAGRSPGPRRQARSSWRRQPRSRVVRADASSSYEPYPWDDSQFYEAALQVVQGTLEGSAHGFLLLMRVEGGGSGEIQDQERGLVLAVGGDTMRSISLLSQSNPSDRPLALDLLWQILERGREISKRDWQLLWVAIVELRGAVFIGRLFFGDPATGRVVWDCDSRPSDSIWLALKAKCPLYVHKRVWEENATPLRELRGDSGAPGAASNDSYQSPEGEPGGSSGAGPARRRKPTSTPGRGSRAGPPPGQGAEGEGDSPSAILTRIRPTDPEPLKRLKMEMKVALKEEDYAAAARIRDHPFMKMHLRIMEHVKAGRDSEASDLEARLHDAVEKYERSGGVDLQDFNE